MMQAIDTTSNQPCCCLGPVQISPHSSLAVPKPKILPIIGAPQINYPKLCPSKKQWFYIRRPPSEKMYQLIAHIAGVWIHFMYI